MWSQKPSILGHVYAVDARLRDSPVRTPQKRCGDAPVTPRRARKAVPQRAAGTATGEHIPAVRPTCCSAKREVPPWERSGPFLALLSQNQRTAPPPEDQARPVKAQKYSARNAASASTRRSARP